MVETDFPGSSSISKIRFDHIEGVLAVTFKSGKVYNYFGVKPELIDQLLEVKNVGDSAGKFFAKNIRNKFTFERVG
jgi:hypothetical protein